MSTPARYDLIVQVGEDFEQPFSIEIGGSALDLTGAVIESQIRKLQNRSSDLIEDFVTAISTGNLEFTLSLPRDTTAEITEPSGWYDVAITLSDEVTYYLFGEVTFTNTITVPA
jgi:hypothetical protein